MIKGLAIGTGHIEFFVAIFEGTCDKYVGCDMHVDEALILDIII